MLSKIPTAGALQKKLFKFSSETFGSLEKVLTFAAAIARKRKFFERFTYQQVVQETYKYTKHTVKDYNKQRDSEQKVKKTI